MTEVQRVYSTAVIGCGRVAQHFIVMLRDRQAEPRLKVVAACDVVFSRAKAFCRDLSSVAYEQIGDMLQKERPDLVFVLTPSGEHVKHARLALEEGCHVISEKPIGLHPDEVYELIQLAEAKGRMYGGIFQNRFNPAIVALRDAVLAGRFLCPVTGTIRLRWARSQQYYQDEWHGTWYQDGGVINQQAIHHVDALQYICGPIEAVCAAEANRVNDLEAEDTLVALVRFESGALGTIEATTALRPEDKEASLSVLGSGGIVEVGGVAMNEILQWEFVEKQPQDANVLAQYSQKVPNGYGLSHGHYFRHLVSCLDDGSLQAPVSAQEAVRAVELVHAIYASVETGGWVFCKDRPRSRRLGYRPKGE